MRKHDKLMQKGNRVTEKKRPQEIHTLLFNQQETIVFGREAKGHVLIFNNL